MSAYSTPNSELYSRVNFAENTGCQQNVAITCNGGCATSDCSCSNASNARASQGEGLDSFADILQGKKPSQLLSDYDVETYTDAMPINEEVTLIPEEEIVEELEAQEEPEAQEKPETQETQETQETPKIFTLTPNKKRLLIVIGLLLIGVVFYLYMNKNKQFGGNKMKVVKLGLNTIDNSSIISL